MAIKFRYLILVFVLLPFNTNAATQASIDLAQQMYVAYYGRPADPGGLAYWADVFDATSDLTEALAAFGNASEFTDNFGSLSNSDLVTNLYQQMYGHAPDSGGLAFYLGRIDTGAATLASIAKQIADGSQSTDLSTLNNRIEVANTFTTQVETTGATYAGENIADAQALLAAVDETAASLTSGNSEATTFVNGLLIPATNTAPIANAGSDKAVYTYSTVYLDGRLSYDPEDDPLTYRWQSVSAPNGTTAILYGTNLAQPYFTPDVEGFYTFKLTVSDGEFTSTENLVTISAVSSQSQVDSNVYVYSFDYYNTVTYLGCWTCNRYSSEAVSNDYGSYGSRYSSTSIRAPYSSYGGRYSSDSACNSYASNPPRLYSSDLDIYYGELSINSTRSNSICNRYSSKYSYSDCQLLMAYCDN